VAWSLWAVAVALDGLFVALLLLNRGINLPGAGYELIESIPFIAGIATIGALVASGRPRNTIGWLLLYLALVLGIEECAQFYAVLSFLHLHRALPGARWAAWAHEWLNPAYFPIPFAIMLMLVPDGRFLSFRWRRVGWIALTANALGVVAVAITPGPLVTVCCNRFLYTTNPIGELFPGPVAAGRLVDVLSVAPSLVAAWPTRPLPRTIHPKCVPGPPAGYARADTSTEEMVLHVPNVWMHGRPPRDGPAQHPIRRHQGGGRRERPLRRRDARYRGADPGQGPRRPR